MTDTIKGLIVHQHVFITYTVLVHVKSCWCYTSRPELLQQLPEGTTTNLHSNQQPH